MSILPRWSGIMSNNSPDAILKYLLSKKRKIYFSVKCYFIRTFCFLKKKLLVSNFCQQFIECWTPLVNNFFINKIFYLKSLFVIFTWESPNLKFLLWRHKIATHLSDKIRLEKISRYELFVTPKFLRAWLQHNLKLRILLTQCILLNDS